VSDLRDDRRDDQTRRAPTRARRALTMVELLICLAVVMILASLITVGMGSFGFRAKALDTANRMQSVLEAIGRHGATGDGNAAYRVQLDGLEEDVRWASLRQVLARLDLEKKPGRLPPNIRLRAEDKRNDAGTGDYSLDAQICWLLRSREWAWGGWKLNDRDYYLDNSSPRRGWPSPIGETLDGTLEILPPDHLEASALDEAWFRAQWPALTETGETRDGESYQNQKAWPPSDWDEDVPGLVPPRWPSPWGRPQISRATGTLAPSTAAHHLGELSPLKTITLLQCGGILPAGAEGYDAYRNDRGKGRPWNDRWGNPLVVVHAVYLPARYDFVGGEDSKDLRGGRDFLIRQAKESYQYTRAVYLAVGAIGPVLREPLPSPWTPEDDPVVLRRLWRQIRETTQAQRWTEKSFSEGQAPWSGVARGQQGEERCFVTAPVEIK